MCLVCTTDDGYSPKTAVRNKSQITGLKIYTKAYKYIYKTIYKTLVMSSSLQCTIKTVQKPNDGTNCTDIKRPIFP